MSTPREVLAVYTHPVKDYATWRKVFDASAPLREKMGVIGAEVFQDPKDPNKIIVVDRYPDIGTLERFLANPAFKEAMSKAGVVGAPTVLVGVAT